MQQSTQSRSSFVLNGRDTELFENTLRQGREVGSKNLFARASQSNNFQVIADFVQFLFTRVKKNEPQKVESLNKKSKEERSEQDEEQLSVHARLRALYQQLLRLQNAQQQTEQTQRDAIVLIQQLMHLEQEAQEEDDELEVDEDSDEESRRPFSETNPPDEELLTAQAWLPHLISRGEIDQLDLYLQLLRESKGVCGATWRPGQIAFKCRTCEKDPTCAICKDCFLNGDHEGHNYSLIKTSSGMCDCGDPDSWDVKGFCRNHSGPAHDPTEHLPSDFRNCVRAVFSGLVHSIYELTIIVPNTSDRNLIFAFEVLEDYCKQSPAIKRFVLQAMLDRDHNQQSRSILDLLLDHHIALPFAVGHWIYQFYSACIADAEFKKLFAIEFVKHYQKIMDNYFDMPQKSGLTHISSITVQLFTVPPIAELLCREHDLLSIMMSTLEEVSAKHLKDDKKRNRKVINAEMKKLFESNALWHYFHDLGYILMHKTIANEFLFDPKYFSVFLKFLAQYQYCVEVERIDSDDETWQTSVNFELRMFPKLFRYIIGGIDELNCEDESNKQALTNLQTAIAVNLSFLKEFITLDKLKYKKSPNPKLKEIVDFDTYQGPISFHIQLHKMISEILVPSVKKQQFTLKQLFNGVDSNLIPELLEHPLRICATISHVRNRLWARNNMHINEQAFYYNHDSWSDYAICMDVFFIQVCYCLMNPELFFTTTLDRYKHNEMFLLTVPESMEPDQHQLMNLLELDYLHFVLTIWSDRSLSALEPASVARKFILHSLFVSQGTFSSLQECVPKQFRIGVDIEEIVRDVADYHSPQSQEQGYFTVKKKYWSELDPYFIHYSPKQFSKIEENYRKLFHKDLTHALPSPDKPYDTMAPVATLIHHSAFHRYLFVVLYRTLNNEHTSESLTICALNAIYLSIETLPYEYLSEEKISLIDNPPQVGGLYQLNFPSENNILVNVKQEFLVEGARQKRSILSMLLDLSDKKDKNKEIERLVGRVLKALCDYDESCKVVIDKHKTNLGKDTSDKEREKKRKRALARQQKIMTSLSSKKIDESLFGEAPATPEEVNQEERKCAFCHEAVSPNGTRNFGMISHLTLSNTLNIVEAQNLDEENKSTSTGNGRDVSSPNYQQLKLENDLVDRFKPSNLYIGKYDELFSDIKANKCVQMNCCSHVCHFDCYDSYFTSLLTTNRRYKGYNLINLQNKEILCPVCGRLANELCPIVHELSEERVLMGVSAQKPLTDVNSDFTFDLKTLKKGFKATIDSKELLNAGDYNWKDTNSVFSLQTTLKNYFSRVMCLHKGKKTGNLDTDEKHIDPSVLGSSLAYTLASHETAQRTIEQSDPKLLTSLRQSEIEQFTTMIESARAYHLLNNSTRQLSQEHLIALYNTIFAEGSILLINHQAEKEDDQSKSKPSPQKAPETMIAPFLTNDLYSLFVKLVLLKPSLVDWKEYSTILQVFYLAHIIQSLLVINCRYKTVSMTTSSKIASEIPPTEFGKIASANEWIASSFITSNQSILKNLSTKIVNLSNEEQVMKSLSLTFMRRMALFTSVLFDTHIPKLDADYDIELLAEQERYGYEFDKLRKWLDLPELSTVFQHLHDGSDSAILASKWLNQLSHSLNTTASYQQPPDKTISIINRLVPKYTLRPRQFHFIELPKLYQTLYLKYHNAECPHCSKKLQLPALCLITGQLVWLKQCDCAASRSREDTSRTVGKCTEFARAHFCGFGFYLIIPLSTVLCLRETRKSILPAFYLDQHGEADNQLQRGVALYLNQSRLNNYIKHFVRGDWDQDTILLEGTDGVQAYRL